MSTLLAVLCLLGFLTLLGMVQQSLSRQGLSAVHRIQLSALARTQARSGVQELLQQASRDLNDERTTLFRAVREAIDDRWAELDLSRHLVGPALEIEPRWGRQSQDSPSRVRSRVLSWRARVRGTRSSKDIGGSEEWVGVLTIGVEAEVADAAASTRREVEESYEIRTVLAAPPRPFDQITLLTGDLESLTDPGQVNSLRREFLDGQRRLAHEMRDWGSVDLSPADAERLRQIAAGMLPIDEVERRTLELPEEPAAVHGFYHAGTVEGRELDLARMLEEERRSVDAAVARLRGARGDGSRAVQALYETVDAYSQALTRIWAYQRMLTVLPREGERFLTTLAPFLPRLESAFFLDRVTLAPALDSSVMKGWREGRARLEGVLDLRRAERELSLGGELRGRTVVVVGPRGAFLEDLNTRSVHAGHRLVVVSLGGDVNVRGEVHASVIMLPAESGGATTGVLRVGPGAVLCGSLVMPEARRSNLQVDGALRYDGQIRTAYPPREDLNKPFRGDYVITVSPDPLFSEGRAR